MAWNYDGKRFRVAQNSASGETSDQTWFVYFQRDNVVWGTYQGGEIVMGTLIGNVAPDGKLEFHYSHVNRAGAICSGICHSIPEVLGDGRIRLHESWRWTTGDQSEGHSVIEECPV